MPFVDFAEIRERLSIEDAAEMLPVKWKTEGQQLRANCPVHGGDRSLIVTPAKGLFVCKTTPAGEKKGGDCIALCAHVMKTTNHEAGTYLAQQIGMLARSSTVNSNSNNSTVSKERATAPQEQKGGVNRPAKPEQAFDVAAFLAKLVYSDDVAALGLSEEDAEHFQVGFYRGKVYAPLRHPSGEIACFYDYGNGALKLPVRSRWLEPSAKNVVRFPKSA